jgi:hypothetical protein
MKRRTPLLVPCLCVLTSRLALAAPPSPEAARAERLVHQATALEKRGDVASAQEVLVQAARLDPEPAVLLALARVQRKLGRLIEARETLMPVALGAAPPAGSSLAAAHAEAVQTFSDIGARIPRLRIAVDSPAAGAGLTITIDGEALPPGAEKLPVPIDPGRHVIVVTSPGMETQTVAFDALEGRDQPVAVHLHRPAPMPAVVVAPVAAPMPPPVAYPPPPLGAPVAAPVVVAAPAADPGAAMPPPAQPVPLTPATPAVAVGTTPAADVDRAVRAAAARRARFSVGRFFLESLGSAVVGSLAAYGTFKAGCGDQPCLSGSLGALGVNVVVTPLTVWGLGEATGGDGGLGWTFLGGLAAFSGYTAGTTDPTLPLVIGVILMPFTSALLYEVSSNANAQRILGPNVSVAPTFVPIAGPSNAPVGAIGGLGGRF